MAVALSAGDPGRFANSAIEAGWRPISVQGLFLLRAGVVRAAIRAWHAMLLGDKGNASPEG